MTALTDARNARRPIAYRAAVEIVEWRFGLPYAVLCPRCGQRTPVHHTGTRQTVADHYDEAATAARLHPTGEDLLPCKGSGAPVRSPVWNPPPGLEPQYELGDVF